MEVYLIRHSRPLIAPGVCYGQSDIQVDSSFESTVNYFKNNLPKGFDRVYTSPLSRCTKLANELFSNPTIDERLKEINFGAWELKNWDDIPKKEIDPWYKNYFEIQPPNGESFNDFNLRIEEFYKELKKKDFERVLIVCHAGVIRSLHLLNNDLKMTDYFDFKVNFEQTYKLIFKI